MGWIFRAMTPPHRCSLPNPYKEKAEVGSIWECDTCHQRWSLEIKFPRIKHHEWKIVRFVG